MQWVRPDGRSLHQTQQCLHGRQSQKNLNLGSLEFSKVLLKEADISVAPGIGFGEYGENFVRIGLVENEHRIRQAARNIKSVFNNANKILNDYSLD